MATKKKTTAKKAAKTPTKKPVKKVAKRTTKKSVKKKAPAVTSIKADNIPQEVPKAPEKKHETPVFHADDKPVLRNNFGYSVGKNDAYDTELSRINEQLKKHTSSYTKPKKHFDIPTVLGIGVMVILIIITGIGLIVLLSDKDTFIDDGVCEVRIETYIAGMKDVGYTKLPETICNTSDDCKNFLLDRGFAQDEVDSMSIRCVERS